MIKLIINGLEVELSKGSIYEYFTKLSKDSVISVDEENSKLLELVPEFIPCISGRCFGSLAGLDIIK